MSAHVLKSSFNAGEISPLMDSRIDAEKYNFSCRRLENFIPRIYGGAFRRPGMMYLGAVGDAANPVSLMPFNVSADTRYIVEFGEYYIRVWGADGVLLTDVEDATLSLVTPYPGSIVGDLKFVQLNNVAFIVHPDHRVYQLVRTFDANFEGYLFTFAATEFSEPCFRSTNQTTVTATPAATTGETTVSFSANIFNEALTYAEYIGSLISITQSREAAFANLDLDATGTSSALSVLGEYTLTTYGTWEGALTIEQQDAAGTYQAVRTFASDGERNITYLAESETIATIRLNYTATDVGSGAPRATLEVHDSRQRGIVRIDEINIVDDLPVVDVTVIDALNSTDATTEWALEAFAEYSGYPRTVAFHEQRLFFAGTALEPNTFWGSAIDDFLNFRRGAFDADSLSFTLAAQEGSAIQSMVSHEALIFFTQTEEWTATTSENTTITPTNIYVRRQSRFGSAYEQAFIANNNIIFLQRGSRKLREFTYTAQEAGGASEDLAVLAEHLTQSGIKQIAFQQQPDPVIWMVTNDGLLISMTYEATQNVTAWSQHPTDGLVKSVAVIYGDEGGSDEVWLVIVRDTGTFIERLSPGHQRAVETDDTEGMIFLDSAIVQENETAFTTVTGLSHLEGLEISVLADGTTLYEGLTVASGAVTIAAANFAIAGLPYTSLLEPSRIEIPMQDGTAQGRKFICKRVTFNLYKTTGMEYADNPLAASINWFAASIPSALYTGEINVNNAGVHSESVAVSVRQSQPYPCNLLGMIAKCDILGD